jgi:hypothetical protein
VPSDPMRRGSVVRRPARSVSQIAEHDCFGLRWSVSAPWATWACGILVDLRPSQ